MAAENGLAQEPLPCDIFDLIVGTSTGGLIAIMLGRLHMSIDECLQQYKKTGKSVFGKPVSQNNLSKILKKATRGAIYDIEILQEEVRLLLESRGENRDQLFREDGDVRCKVEVPVCLSPKPKLTAITEWNYESLHPTQENYDCTIWEAASATSAAPMFFHPVKFGVSDAEWCDGGIRRNNPINEALSDVDRETERAWQGRVLGCVVSIGTGVVDSQKISNSVGQFLKAVLKILTDSEDTADSFLRSAFGQDLERSRRYFRFNVPHGLHTLQIDEWDETEKLGAVTSDYLSKYQTGNSVSLCAQALIGSSLQS
ncbi:phospholipase [Hyaloscypha finlandica]|nr:phospholipase [Hyaloscypha finlandica]